MVVNITEKLMDLGLSKYEARTYLTLLGSSPSTAYETARGAGIPTSKIYGVMEKLLRRGMIQLFDEEGKKRYTPLAPEEFIDSHKSQVELTLNSLKKDLLDLKTKTDISIIWNMKTYERLMQKSERIIQETKHTLLLSLWKEEMNLLHPLLKKARSRNVKISIVHFGETEKEEGALFKHPIFEHPIEQTIYTEKGGRGFALVADSREALIGTIQENGSADGAWSQNKGFVSLAEDYIKHDIYIMKIVNRFNNELIKKFGKNYEKLRDIFSDEEESQ